MAKNKFKKVKEELLIQLSGRKITPEKILVFGSRAKNKHNAGSDVDIIVVSRSFRKKNIFEKAEMTKGVHLGLVKKIKTPADIIYCSDKEWEKGDTMLLNMVKDECEIIYG